jgi:hypothetical protein
MKRVRVLAACAVIAVVIGGVVAVDTSPPAARQSAAQPQASGVGATCTFIAVQPCVLFDGIAVSMAAPLLHASVRGTDGGTTRTSIDFTTVNAAGAHSASGTVNGRAFSLVPSGFVDFTDHDETVQATGSAIFGIVGTHYRYVVYSSQFEYSSPVGASTVALSVQGTDRVYTNCIQHGSIRRPLSDCAPGTQRIARGSVTTSPLGPPGTTYTATIPLDYIEQSVAPNGAGLSGPTRTSSGHWSLRAALDPHGRSSIWSTEWSVGGIDQGREAGASNIVTGTNAPIGSHSDPYTI